MRGGRLALIAFLTALLVFAARIMLELFVRSMLYPAPALPVGEPPPFLQEVQLPLDDGNSVVAWHHRHVEENAPAVLFFHGNGENLATLHRSGYFEAMRALGVSFLAVDYPGYGRSSGRPSEASLVAAGEAGFSHLEAAHPAAPTVVLGWSLGAAVAAQVAARTTRATAVGGLVLMSPWEDLPSLAATQFPRFLVRIALKDRYDTRDAASTIRCPTLIIHGAQDRLIPVHHGERLQDAFPTPPRFVAVPQTGHNDLLVQPEVWRHLGDFLEQFGPAS